MNVTVITDASFCPAYNVAGYGFWIACNRGKLSGCGQITGYVRDTNEAEMVAVYKAIQQGAHDQIIKCEDSLLIQLDSLAAIDRLEANRIVTCTEQHKQIIYDYNRIVSQLNLTIEFRHVRGHTKNTGAKFVANRWCDRKARHQMKTARKLKESIYETNARN